VTPSNESDIRYTLETGLAIPRLQAMIDFLHRTNVKHLNMPAESSTTPPPKPVEIIYSCSVCHKTISEIYKEIQNDQGFRDENDTNDGQPITKLWMTECAHLTCSEHLEGGGGMKWNFFSTL